MTHLDRTDGDDCMIPTDPGHRAAHSDKMEFCIFFLGDGSECALYVGRRMKLFADQEMETVSKKVFML